MIMHFFDYQYIRLLTKPRIWFSRQEEICANPEFTGVNKDLEQIFDEPSGAKAMVLQAVY